MSEQDFKQDDIKFSSSSSSSSSSGYDADLLRPDIPDDDYSDDEYVTQRRTYRQLQDPLPVRGTVKNRKGIRALDDEEQALSSLYSQAYHGGRGGELVFANRTRAPPMARAQRVEARKQRASERKKQLMNMLRGRYADATDEELASKARKAANAYAITTKRAGKRSRAQLRAAGIEMVNKNDPNYQLRQDLLMQRRSYPNAIADPALYQYRNQAHIRGKAYDQPLRFQQWMHKTPQQLTPDDRKEMAYMFAEMNGVLGWMPRYDRRFLTEASAKVALNDPTGQYYSYDLYDMDDNAFTPGTLIVTDNDDGRIVSVGGYLMDDATGGQSEARMKDMMYFNDNPSRVDRKKTPRAAYLASKNLTRTNNAGKKVVREFIERLLAEEAFSKPIRNWNASLNKYVEIPVCITLNAFKDGRSTNIVNYTLSSVTWNALVAHITQLYCCMYVYPVVKYDDFGLVPFVDLYGGRTFDTELGNTDQVVVEHWHEWLIDPRVEAHLLKNKYFQKQLKDLINERTTEGESDRVNRLIDIVCAFMMNTDMDLILNAVGVRSVRDLLVTSSGTYDAYPYDGRPRDIPTISMTAKAKNAITDYQGKTVVPTRGLDIINTVTRAAIQG